MTNEIKINPEIFDSAKEIFSTLADQRPEHSLSFVLSKEGTEAVLDSIKIVEWGIGGNKPKLKEAALEVLGDISAIDAGSPINVNLTEYELKAMGEVVMAIEKAESDHQDGILA